MSAIRRLSHAFAFSLLCSVLAGTAGAQIITTLAGGALPVTPLPGTTATISPVDLAADAAGNVYISSGNVVYKLDPTGALNRVAGNGLSGYSGDGGNATSAQLSNPKGLAVDAGGNLYIADTANERVRKVTLAGIITTVAGNGTQGFSGDGGPATSAQFYGPDSVAVDAGGNLYIADLLNFRVRKVSAATGTITTVAGNGSSGYSGDGGSATNAQLSSYVFGVAVDAGGNLYIADTGNQRVRKVTSAGIITTVAGNGTFGYSGDGGPATSAQLDGPHGVALDSNGNLYIEDDGNDRIRKVSTAGIITTVAGNGTQGYSGDGGLATGAELDPSGMTVDASGNLYIGDFEDQNVRKISAGIITTVAGDGSLSYFGDGGPATSAQLNSPYGVAVDANGNLYFVDTDNQRVREVSAGLIFTVAGNGSGGYSGDGGPATSAQLYYPGGVALDASGNLYIADGANQRVRKVSRQRGKSRPWRATVRLPTPATAARPPARR